GNSIIIITPSAPDARARRARLLLERPQFRRCIRGRSAAAIKQHHAREVLIINATSVVAAAGGGFACHLSTSEVALEVAPGPAAGAFDAQQPGPAALNPQHPRTLLNPPTSTDRR